MGKILSIFFLFIVCSTSAQEQLIRKSADRAFEEFAYSEALEKYQLLYLKDSGNLHYISRLSETYLKLNDSKKAEVWLGKLVEKHEGFDNRKLYEYAQVLSKNEKYDQAKYWYGRFKERGGITSVDDKINGIENIRSFFAEEGKYSIERLDFNTSKSDFSPFYYQDGIAFVSSRKEKEWVKNTYNWDESDYLDFYYYNPGDTSLRLSKIKGLNSKYHEGPSHIYAGGQKIVFTRNSVQGSKLQRDQKGTANLQLFFGEISEGKWVITPFQHNTVEYSLGHPAISEDGTILIFASDMPGGFGGTDLYVSKKGTFERWSEPVNLGNGVNTSEDEMFPFLSGDHLWFASNGREGLGGLDIYQVQFQNNKVSGVPENVGAPINSSQDDFGLITLGNFREGYFASDRAGSDDIYSYVAEFVNVKGRVLAKGSHDPILGAKVTLEDRSGRVIGTALTDSEGVYDAQLGKEAVFSIRAEKVDFLLEEPIQENTSGVSDFKELEPVFLLQRLMTVKAVDAESKETLLDAIQTVKVIGKKGVVAPIEGHENQYLINPVNYEVVTAQEGYYTLRDTVTVADDFYGMKDYVAELKKIVVGESIRLDNIYYDVNSANLRAESELELDKVVVFMKDNPHIKIELSSHTDSRGSAPYNQRLSQKRAESATEFLISHGVERDRIVPKGYGESKVVNRCKDGVRCSAEEHQENRRTEIKILEND